MPTVVVPTTTLVDASTPVPVTGTPAVVATASAPSPGSGQPTYTPSVPSSGTGPTYTATVLYVAPGAPVAVSSITPCAGTLDDPCFSKIVFPELHENVGGAIIGTLIIFAVLSFVIARQLRLLLLGAWLVAVVLTVFTGLLAWLYGWLLIVAVLGWVDGVRALFGMERVA
jgi:hypothetical protein